MIKERIRVKFINQYNSKVLLSDNIYVVDYSEATRYSPVKRDVEFFSPTPPADIDYFSIINTNKLDIVGIKFDNSSFVYPNGNAKSQCEGVFFSNNSTNSSWILFCELKYSSRPSNNESNLLKAIKQLYKTRYHYIQESIINQDNTCYLIASLPKQRVPFANFSLTQSYLTKLKTMRNIVLRLNNSVEVLDDEIIIA